MAAQGKVIPRHVAIIMDGNGRWARERGLPRIKGHEEGAKAVKACVEGCGELKDRISDPLRLFGRELAAAKERKSLP